MIHEFDGIDQSLEPLVDPSATPSDLYAQNAVGSNQLPPAHNSPNEKAAREFDGLRVIKTSLTALERIYRAEDEVSALDGLGKKQQIVLGDADLVPRDADMGFLVKHHLDFLAAVPLNLGCDAILPENPTPDFEFVMDPTQGSRQLGLNHGRMGFDAAGAAMYFGRTQNGLDAFICLVPAVQWLQGDFIDAETIPSGPTPMSLFRQTIVCSWVLYLLSKMPNPIAWINLQLIYETWDMDAGKADWSGTTNFECVPDSFLSLYLYKMMMMIIGIIC